MFYSCCIDKLVCLCVMFNALFYTQSFILVKKTTTIKSSFSRLHHQAILHFFSIVIIWEHVADAGRTCRREKESIHTKWINKLSESFVLRFARNFLTVCCVLQRKVFQINFHSYRMKHAGTAVVIFMDLTIEKRHKKKWELHANDDDVNGGGG